MHDYLAKAIADTRVVASLLEDIQFRGGMDTACDEIETRLALPSSPVSQSVEQSTGEPIDGEWYWVLKENVDSKWEWYPAQRESNHWNSAKFSGIPLHEVKIGPSISQPIVQKPAPAMPDADEEGRLFVLLADIRAACGDNGKRMQDELVTYIRELAVDAERYRRQEKKQ